MPRALFRDIVTPSSSIGSQASYTVPLSVLAHVIVCGAVLIAPLMAADVLPAPQTIMAFAAPPPPPVPPPPPARRANRESAGEVRPIAEAAPREAPPAIAPERPRFVPETLSFGIEGGLPRGQLGGLPIEIPSGPLAALPSPAAAGPARIGGDITAPLTTRHVNPVYPHLAQIARVEGVVLIDATIGPDGRVRNARVLQGVPLLDRAALDAVEQWRFTPTLLNGVPVPVIMTVRVQFKLQ